MIKIDSAGRDPDYVAPADRGKPEYEAKWRAYAIRARYYENAPEWQQEQTPEWYLAARDPMVDGLRRKVRDARFAADMMGDPRLNAAALCKAWQDYRDESAKRAPAPIAQETEPDPVIVPLETNPFAEWFAASGLTATQVAERFGASIRAVHYWKLKGAPADVMAQLA